MAIKLRITKPKSSNLFTQSHTVHITPLVIHALGGTHTHTHTHTDIYTEVILRNQASRLACAWLKNRTLRNQPSRHLTGHNIPAVGNLWQACMAGIVACVQSHVVSHGMLNSNSLRNKNFRISTPRHPVTAHNDNIHIIT